MNPCPESEESLPTQVFRILQDLTGLDHRSYQWSPFQAALGERAFALGLSSLGDYLRHLRSTPREGWLLRKEALIGMTAFYRDRGAFQALREQIRKTILPYKKRGSTFRAWIPGVSTGQEAFSLAVLLHDLIEEEGSSLEVRIVASDVNDDALESAAQGSFSSRELENLDPSLRDHYFPSTSKGRRVADDLWRSLFFLHHDLLSDPPLFENLDLISCRNVLIYFRPEARRDLLLRLHQSMAPRSILFLGSSENVMSAPEAFSLLPTPHKIFAPRIPTPSGAFQIIPK